MTDESIYMLNALWFKPDGGAKKYAEYISAAGPFVQQLGGETLQSFRPVQALQGDFDADLMFIVRWPNQAAFESLIADPGYQQIAHLSTEAIERAFLTCLEPAGTTIE
jgi:uncharacterized protein (DUF1330 family)